MIYCDTLIEGALFFIIVIAVGLVVGIDEASIPAPKKNNTESSRGGDQRQV